MKKILFAVFMLMSFISYSQSTGYLRYDSVRIQRGGGNSTLIIENATRNVTGGFLQNYGEGRTKFARALDSVWVDGDSLRFRYGTTTIAVLAPSGGGPAFGFFNDETNSNEVGTIKDANAQDYTITNFGTFTLEGANISLLTENITLPNVREIGNSELPELEAFLGYKGDSVVKVLPDFYKFGHPDGDNTAGENRTFALGEYYFRLNGTAGTYFDFQEDGLSVGVQNGALLVDNAQSSLSTGGNDNRSYIDIFSTDPDMHDITISSRGTMNILSDVATTIETPSLKWINPTVGLGTKAVRWDEATNQLVVADTTTGGGGGGFFGNETNAGAGTLKQADNESFRLTGVSQFGVRSQGASVDQLSLDPSSSALWSPTGSGLVAVSDGRIDLDAPLINIPSLAGVGSRHVGVNADGDLIIVSAGGGSGGDGISQVIAGFGLDNINDSTLAIDTANTDLQDWITDLIPAQTLKVGSKGTGVSIWQTNLDSLLLSRFVGINGIDVTKLADSTIQISADTTNDIASIHYVDSLFANAGGATGNIQEVESLADADYNQAIYDGSYWVKFGVVWKRMAYTDSIQPSALTSPSPLNLTVVDDDQINASWTNVANETNYELQRGTASDYSDAVTINSPAVNVTTYNNTGLSPSTHYYYRIRAIGDGTLYSNSSWANADATTDGALDTDASAYIAAVEATGATISTPHKSAINTFVLGLKSNSLWTKIYDAWPLIGGTASSHSISLKGLAPITWSGTVTHSSTGMEGNGTTGYGQTGVIPSTHLTLNDIHMGVYIGEDVNESTIDMGCSNASARIRIGSRISGNASHVNLDNTSSTVATANSLGLYVTSRAASGTKILYKNGSAIATNAVATITRPSTQIFIGAENASGSAASFSSKKISYASTGASMSAGEQTTYNTLVEALQDALGRGVQ